MYGKAHGACWLRQCLPHITLVAQVVTANTGLKKLIFTPVIFLFFCLKPVTATSWLSGPWPHIKPYSLWLCSSEYTREIKDFFYSKLKILSEIKTKHIWQEMCGQLLLWFMKQIMIFSQRHILQGHFRSHRLHCLFREFCIWRAQVKIVFKWVFVLWWSPLF